MIGSFPTTKRQESQLKTTVFYFYPQVCHKYYVDHRLPAVD